MSQITVTLPDGSTRQVSTGTPVLGVAKSISPGLAKQALAAIVNDQMVDMSHILHADSVLTLLTERTPEALALYRHSTAHLMAAAVTALFPEAQCGIGPATED